MSDPITITGAGAASTVIDAAGIDRILHVLTGADAGISGLTLTRGELASDGGGAVFAEGTFRASGCAFVRNHMGCGAVRLEADSSFDSCLFEENTTVEFGRGAALCAPRPLVRVNIADSIFSRNEAGEGGAILAGQVTTFSIVRSVFEQNRANALTAFGVGGGAIQAWASATVTIEDSSFLGNHSALEGGAIGGYGSGHGYNLVLRRVTLAGNSADYDGGAIHAAVGWPPGSLEISDSTIVGNSANGRGGAIFMDGQLLQSVLVNSTVSANSGTSVFVDGYAQFASLNSTIMADQVAISLLDNATVELGRSIVVGATESDCTSTVVSLGHNILSDAPGFCMITGDTATDLVGVDPLLGPLQDNGGPTLTHALLPGSPAIDAGADTCTDELGAPLVADQRGQPRPGDGDADGIPECDIGAFEQCGPDSDGDTLGDACDCALADAGSWNLPGDADLRVVRDAATNDALVSWQNLALAAGSGTLYEVASASLDALWSARIADGPCVATGLASASWTDARPVADRGWYYLARGVNACGPPRGQGWGRDSLGVERPACP